MGALVQAAQHFHLEWKTAASWEHEVIGEIELSEGSPAMVKHLLLQDRLRCNKTEYVRATAKRREEASQNTGGDLSIERAVDTPID